MKRLIIPLIAFTITGCSATQLAWVDSRLATLQAGANKIMELAPRYCQIRPETRLDDIALAAIALATSERAANTIKSGVDKVCEWIGVSPEKK